MSGHSFTKITTFRKWPRFWNRSHKVIRPNGLVLDCPVGVGSSRLTLYLHKSIKLLQKLRYLNFLCQHSTTR